MGSIRSTARITTARVVAAVAAAAMAGGVLAGCTVPGAGTPAAASAAPTAAGSTGASGSTGAARTTTTAPAGAVGAEELAVATALQTYQSAVASGNYTLACSLMTVESSARLVSSVQAGAGVGAVVPGCVQALEAVLTQPEAVAAAVEAASSITVTDVTIEGMSATVRWTSTRQGVPRTDTLSLQKVNLQWLVAGPA